jgi:DNA phosphorothioation-dependent restriction protein DptH
VGSWHGGTANGQQWASNESCPSDDTAPGQLPRASDFGDSAVGSGGSDVHSVMRAGTLVIADLSDPLRTKEEANGIFHVLLQQFRSVDVGSSGGKLLVLDEAHKFVSGTDGLSREIVNSVRLMRHEGMRLAVSPELLELTTVAVVHRFHSHDWFAFLGRKIRLPPDAFHDIAKLDDGMALLSASKPLTLASGETIDAVGLPIRVRPRLTADHGSTLMANRRRAKMK